MYIVSFLTQQNDLVKRFMFIVAHSSKLTIKRNRVDLSLLVSTQVMDLTVWLQVMKPLTDHIHNIEMHMCMLGFLALGCVICM